jgi:hypothetical protein
MQVSYTYINFLEDLPKIREQTIMEKIIVLAWAKSSLFPLDSSIVLKRLKKYLDAELEPELPPHSSFFFNSKDYSAWASTWRGYKEEDRSSFE